jgi:hypothetical protein
LYGISKQPGGRAAANNQGVYNDKGSQPVFASTFFDRPPLILDYPSNYFLFPVLNKFQQKNSDKEIGFI